ncbi:Mating-type protein beta1-1 [Termitomyces sp. J132]|nr:Mating-type protein beta1-1 [Termitomyces sp. J132]
MSAIESSLLDFQPSRVDDFYRQYDEYTNTLEMAIRANLLSPSTIALAAALSIKVYHTIESSFDVERLSMKLMESFLDETAVILDCSTTNTSSPPAYVSGSALAPYIKPSYEWLVANIQNPYPSPVIRDAIARQAGTVRKDVDSWFMDARKRIGWNDARKTYFSNKRADIIDAATRFYANDEKLSLSQGAEHALISIMKNAKNLYCDKFNQTVLASKLDAAVKDLTPQTKAGAKAEQLRHLQMKKARDSYPSPERSPEPADLSPALCHQSALAQPTSISNRKRRNMRVEPADVDQVEDTRTVKRARLDELSSSSSPKISPLPTGLPSPVPSIDGPSEATEPSNLSSSSQPAPTVPSHKRRLSESDVRGALKRPRNLPHGPRLQAVSDPLSMTSALFDAYSTPFDSWFEQNFDLSNVIDGDGDDLTGFDFEIGSFPDADVEFGLHAGSSSDGEQALELLVPAMPPELHSTISAKSSSFGDLQSSWSHASSSINPDNSGQVPFIMKDTCVPPLSSRDFDHNHTSGLYSAYVIDSVTTPYSLLNPDFTWSLPDIRTSLTCDCTYPGRPLLVPEGCSGLVVASSPTLLCHEDNSTRLPEQAATREEKLMQLLKMREDTLKLELELATT